MSILVTATIAAGCFWGVETLFKKLPGVIETKVGYTGSSFENPTYQMIVTGDTGHAEALQIKFNPKIINYERIINYFFRLHDPTTLNQQGNDRGTQYRSAVFYHSIEQKKIAEKVIENLKKKKIFKNLIVTEVVKAGIFYKAEDYHQNYHDKNPNGYSCHNLRPEWN